MLKNISHRNIFLIDGIGAVITALSLSLILAQFEPIFGMPANILYLLAGIAAIFALYSITCYLLLNNNWPVFLKGIAVANTLYCLLSMALVVYFYHTLTWIGIAYFIGEVVLVMALVSIELRLKPVKYN